MKYILLKIAPRYFFVCYFVLILCVCLAYFAYVYECNWFPQSLEQCTGVMKHSYRFIRAAMWVLETKYKSSAKAHFTKYLSVYNHTPKVQGTWQNGVEGGSGQKKYKSQRFQIPSEELSLL